MSKHLLYDLRKQGNNGEELFWQVELDGNFTTISVGKEGRKPRQFSKEHLTAAMAKKYAVTQMNIKKRQGYQQDGQGSTTRDSTPDIEDAMGDSVNSRPQYRTSGLKKTYSSLVRHAIRRARGTSAPLMEQDEDGDTDSVASSASSINHPRRRNVAEGGEFAGVSPLNRRRSLRIAAKQEENGVFGAVGNLQSQNTVIMSPEPALHRMETNTRWENYRGSTRKNLQKQDTVVPSTSQAAATTKRTLPRGASKWLGWRNDDPGKESVDGTIPKTAKLESQDTLAVKMAMMKRKSTTADLRSMMMNTRLETMQVDQVDAGPSRMKRKAAAIQSPTPEASPKKPSLKKGTTTKLSKKVTVVTPDEQSPGRAKREQTPEDDNQTGHLSKKRRGSLKRQSTIVSQSGDVYVPPRNQWPLDIQGQVVWCIPLKKSTGENKHALAVYVSPARCLIGDEDGIVTELDATVTPIRQLHLHTAVNCILPDGDDRLYAGCNDGGLYDITYNEPRLIWQAKGFRELVGLDIYQGQVAVSDIKGNVALLAYDGSFLWKQKSSGEYGWMVCVDDTGVYHGHYAGITKYSLLDGKKIWHTPSRDPVMAGVKHGDALYVASGASVVKVDKLTGNSVFLYDKGKGSVGTVHSVAVGSGLVFVSGNVLLAYEEITGALVYKVMVQGSERAQLYYFQGRVFMLGNRRLDVVDFTKASIDTAKAGKCIETYEVSTNPAVPSVKPLKRAPTMSSQHCHKQVKEGAVLLECYNDSPKARQGKLKVRALSVGYNNSNDVERAAIQFPSELLLEGVRYVVEGLQEAEGAKYYRVSGSITEVKDEQ